MSATDLGKKLLDERQGFSKWYDDNKNSQGVFNGNVDEFHKRNEALNSLADDHRKASEADAAIKSNNDAIAQLLAPQDRLVKGGDIYPGMGPILVPSKTLGERFVESDAYKGRPHAAGATGPELKIELDQMYGKGRGFKTIFDTGSSFAIQNVRLPEPITPGSQIPTVASLMPEGRTSGNAILYMEETTTTSNAAETAESGTKPEAALAFTQRTSNVRKIAVTLPVTDESLDDIPFIESYIDTRLSLFIRIREDAELLKGGGTGSDLTGIQTTSGINTQAAGSDSNADAIFKGAIAAEVASFFPVDAVVMHPTNWSTMRLSKDDVGNYLFGPPNTSGAEQVFGYRIVKTTAETLGTALAGAFQTCAEVFRRTDLNMQVGWINDQFTKNQRTILVEERLALVVFRPSGFTKITGLS